MNNANNLSQDEPVEQSADAVESRASAGQLLREARQAQDIDIALLASMMKLSVSKLQALEDDRYDLLPDLAFTRSLAIAMCRRLGIDDTPVLDALPELDGPQTVLMPMEQIERKPHKVVIGSELGRKKRSRLWWILGALLIALAVLYFMPAKWYEPLLLRINMAVNNGAMTTNAAPLLSDVNGGEHVGGPVNYLPQSSMRSLAAMPENPSAVTAGTYTSVAVVPLQGPLQTEVSPADEHAITANEDVNAPLAVEPSDGQVGVQSASAQAESSVQGVVSDQQLAVREQVLRFNTVSESWVEVKTKTGETLAARLLPAGGDLVLPLDMSESRLPLSVKVGNMQGTTVVVRGTAFDMHPYTRDNVARFEVR